MFDINKIMAKAISLSKKAGSNTFPNPRVGAIIFDDDGNIISTGYHKKIGAPHAEQTAIYLAHKKGINLKGKNIAVSLEPCNHIGKTPACSQLIVKSGIKSVYIAQMDTNKNVKGGGVDFLKSRGIQVFTGIKEKEARAINNGFNKYNTTKLPFVTLKLALSLDGKVNHPSKSWFTSSKAKAYVHQIRNMSDLIITGSGTVKIDNPAFTTRIRDKEFLNNIWVLSSTLSKDNIKNYKIVKNNVKVLNEKKLKKILHMAGEKGYREILIEAGPTLFSSFLELGKAYIDRLIIFIQPEFFGTNAKGLNIKDLSLISRIKMDKIKKMDNTLFLEGSL